MTTKEYKKMCRIRVERLAKILTFILVSLTLGLGVPLGVLTMSQAIFANVVNSVWFFAPDICAYILENIYRLSHNKTSYR